MVLDAVSSEAGEPVGFYVGPGVPSSPEPPDVGLSVGLSVG
ncbi:hypothetical protein [Streptomyces aureocirculatus]|nr:hypothetical protein [Streptomyces aureocirculatus]